MKIPKGETINGELEENVMEERCRENSALRVWASNVLTVLFPRVGLDA
jgi:hypothetical protein